MSSTNGSLNDTNQQHSRSSSIHSNSYTAAGNNSHPQSLSAQLESAKSSLVNGTPTIDDHSISRQRSRSSSINFQTSRSNVNSSQNQLAQGDIEKVSASGSTPIKEAVEEIMSDDEVSATAEEETSARAILGSILKSSTDRISSQEIDKLPDETEKANPEEDEFGDGSDDIADEIQNTLDFLAESEKNCVDPSATDPAFTRLRQEYDRLHKLFMQSRRNEKALIKKCKDLSSELSANSAKVQAALKLSHNDRSSIANLKKEVKKAWKMVESGNEKDQRAKEAINSLKNEVETLKKSIAEQGGVQNAVSNSFGTNSGTWGKINETQEQAIQELTIAKATLSKHIESLTSENSQQFSQIEDLESKVETLTTERGTLDHEVHSLKDLLATKKSELDRDLRIREKLEATLRTANEINSKKDLEVQIQMQEVRQLQNQYVKLENMMKDEKNKIEKIEKEKENLNGKYTRVQTEYEEQVLTFTRLMGDNQKQATDLKQWEEDYSKMKEELRNITRVKDSLSKKMKVLEEAKLEAEMERDALKGTNHGLAHDLEGVRHEIIMSHKKIENVTRERDIAQKNFVKSTGATQKQLNVVKLSEQTKHNLEQEIMSYKEEASKMRKLIYSLEKDRDR
ncbi:hypothetical protein HK096_006983, partial [Nowakowskiella sp. JEL0078]